MGKRFASINVENNETNRRNYRELLFTAGPDLSKHVSGVILYEETLFQNAEDGTPMVKLLKDKGIIPGIKVDTGTVPLAGTDGECTTQGFYHIFCIFYRKLYLKYFEIVYIFCFFCMV